jgi:hypothetical protein
LRKTTQYEFDVDDYQDQETPEKNGVVQPKKVAPGNRTLLSKRVEQHVPDTLTNIVKTIIGSSQCYPPKTLE